MDIVKWGAQRYRGTKYLIHDLKLNAERSWRDNIEWNAAKKQVTIGRRWVAHGDGRTSHNYEITLTLSDISALIEIHRPRRIS